MAKNLPATWIPPDLSDLVLENCNALSNWMVKILKTGDIPLFSTQDVLWEGLSDYLRKLEIDATRTGDIIGWWVEDAIGKTQQGESFYVAILNYTLAHCMNEVCPQIGWQGNSDLAGRGMVVNYIIQAALATLYSCFLLVFKPQRNPKTLTGHTVITQGIAAVQLSTRVFLDSALIFCMSMLVAAIYTFIRGLLNPVSPLTTYSSLTTVYLSLYSIIPALLLHLCTSEALRRRRWRTSIWVLLFCLTVFVISLYLKTGNMPKQYDSPTSVLNSIRDPEHQLQWEFLCLNRETTTSFMYAARTLIGLSLAVPFATFLIVLTQDRYRHPVVVRLFNEWRLITTLFCLSSMWAFLCTFLYFRKQMGKGSGALNKDHEWTFGQVLALVTWVPVLVDAIYIWNQGPTTALTGQLMEGYKVVTSSSTPHDTSQETSGDASFELLGYKQISY